MAIHIGKSGTTVVEFAQPQEIVISQADDSIKVGDGTDLLAVNADGSINVAATTSAASSSIKVSDGTDTLAITADGHAMVHMHASCDTGASHEVRVDQFGALDSALPLLPFGSLHTEKMTPSFQVDGTYGLNTQLVNPTSSGSGAVASSNSAYTCSTGTTVGSTAVLQTQKRLRYRPGQGIIGRFTAKYTSPVASSYQLAGLGHAEDGVYFGYKDTDFGILYINRGVRECRTLTIATGSSTAQSITITLNGVAFSVAVTNSGSTVRTAYEISLGTYTGWTAAAVGATVVFLADSAASLNGTYSLSAATTAVGTFARTKAGVASTDSFIKQTDWNGDKLNGTGDTGITLDQTKFNVFQIKIQYLGAGAITFEIETCTASSKPRWTVVHVMRLPNTLTASTFSNPSFPFTMAAYSAGSTTDLTVSSICFAGFIEGEKFMHGPRFSTFNSITTVGATNLQVITSIQNSLYYAGKSNQCVVNLVSMGAALKHTSPCIFYLIKNGTLGGTPNFAALSSNSVCTIDTAATTVTYATNDQLVWTGHLGDTGNLDHHFNGASHEEFVLQPGEMYTLAARAVTGTPAYVTGSMNIREDQ